MTEDVAGAQAHLDLAEHRDPARSPRRAGACPLPRRQSLLPARRHRGLPASPRPEPWLCPGVRLGAARGRGAGRSRRRRLCPWPDDLGQAHYERCLALCREHGLGRIEAAHRQMLGLTKFFGNDVRGALADALAAAAAAHHIGQPRGEMVAHMIAAEMYANLMMLEEATVAARRGGAADRAARCRTVRATCCSIAAPRPCVPWIAGTRRCRCCGARSRPAARRRSPSAVRRRWAPWRSRPTIPTSGARRSMRARACCAPAR